MRHLPFIGIIVFFKYNIVIVVFRSEVDMEPPIKKPKSNGAMKEEKSWITDSPADIVDEVKLDRKE